MAAVSQRGVMTVTGEMLYLNVAGQTAVGIRLFNTWVGTASFFGSFDGVNFSPIYVTPYPQGTNVKTTTATGSWFVPVGNYKVIAVQFTSRTSGSLSVTMVASTDGEWQSAYLAASARFINANNIATTTSSTTWTATAQANQAQRLKWLQITTSKNPSWLITPNVKIYDGDNTGTILAQFDLPNSGSSGVIYPITLPAGGIVNTPGNALTIVVCSAGSGCTVNVNGEVEPA